MKPEGKVKDMVSAYLRSVPGLFYFMPIGGPYSVGGIPDYVGCYKGQAFCIETKAPGRRGHANMGLSALQVLQKNKIEAAGGAYFVVDGEESLVAVREWVLSHV